MKKISRISIRIVSCLLLVIIGVLLYRRNTNIAQASLRDLIKKQFIADQHHLDLRYKNFTQMPDICSVISPGKQADDIWSIDLGNNQITSISEDFSCLKNLSELNLGFNKINKIQNVRQLTWLSKLDLGNNKLTRIEGLDTLQRLQSLHLGYNQITSTAGLEKLVNLSSLQLQHNQLTDISDVSHLVNLETLKLEFNKLTDEDVIFIPSLKKLKIITVAENVINPEKVAEWNEQSLKNMH